MNNIVVINQFVANTLDLYDEPTFQSFIDNNSINMDFLLNHPITKLNVLYNVVWNTIFGTWATKKDFMDFVTVFLQLRNIKNVHVTFDSNLFNAITSHEPFMITRLVLNKNVDVAKKSYIDCIPKLVDKKYIIDILDTKWRHRFKVSSTTQPETNFLKCFVKYYLNSFKQENPIYNWENVSKFTPQDINITEIDKVYMTSEEIFQYVLHRDNRFLLQLSTGYVIVTTNGYVPTSLIQAIQKDFKKHVVIVSFQYDKSHTKNEYIMDFHHLRMLPKIASKYIYITSDITCENYPLPLCQDKNDCSLIVTTNKNDIPSEVFSQYHIVFTDNYEYSKPRESKYFVPLNLKHEDIISCFWKHYLTTKCPFSFNNYTYNSMLFMNFLAKYCNIHFDTLVSVISTNNYIQRPIKNCSLVLVDNRFNILSILSALISYYNILRHPYNIQKCNWSLKIITSTNEVDNYTNWFSKLGITSNNGVSVQQWNGLDIDLFHMETYNSVLKDANFWRQIGGEKCIIIQDDGMLINGENIEDYLLYDYVGAPWSDTKGNEYIKNKINSDLVGNGGFSVRDVNKMIQICNEFVKEKNDLFYHNINEIPEDVYFIQHLIATKSKVAPFDIARQFSMEQVPVMNSVGFHKFWLYHLSDTAQTFFDSML